jgi:hypothetical protein
MKVSSRGFGTGWVLVDDRAGDPLGLGMGWHTGRRSGSEPSQASTIGKVRRDAGKRAWKMELETRWCAPSQCSSRPACATEWEQHPLGDVAVSSDCDASCRTHRLQPTNA